MENTKFSIFFILIVVCLFSLNQVKGQCMNQIFHPSGTQIINGVQVTASSFGNSGIATHYCPNSTQPYYVGSGTTSGGYTFQFSPAVDSISLNFGGIHYSIPAMEIIKIYVNGSHYINSSVGLLNGCDSLARLTTSGDITGVPTGNPSGCNDTKIIGPISQITVFDSIISGGPNGVVFSIFFCSPIQTSISENIEPEFSVYPIPTNSNITVKSKNKSELEILNLQGQVILKQSLLQEISDIDISAFEKGIYILSIIQNNKRMTRKIVRN